MNSKIARLITLLLLLVMVSSCGRTIYRQKYVKSKKWSHYKTREHFWHRHHFKPRTHSGGYW